MFFYDFIIIIIIKNNNEKMAIIHVENNEIEKLNNNGLHMQDYLSITEWIAIFIFIIIALKIIYKYYKWDRKNSLFNPLLKLILYIVVIFIIFSIIDWSLSCISCWDF